VERTEQKWTVNTFILSEVAGQYYHCRVGDNIKRRGFQACFATASMPIVPVRGGVSTVSTKWALHALDLTDLPSTAC
jgi:hypothetical protein